MSTIDDQFSTLAENLKLDPGQVARARELHNDITDILKDAGLAVGAFLQGSFARGTMRKPLNDVDKVILLSNSVAEQFRKPGGPAESMVQISDAIGNRIGPVTYEPNKHALGITLHVEGFDFDAVPAFDTDSKWVEIANTEDDTWDRSNTRQLIKVISDRNADTSGRFIHWVRMIKEAVHHNGISDLLPGLHVETFAHAAVTSALDDDVACAMILRTAATMIGQPYCEPTGVDQISDRLDVHEKQKIGDVLSGLASDAEVAVRLAQDGDIAGASAAWRDIFGDEFPEHIPDVKSMLSALGHGAGIGPSGDVSHRFAGARPARSWRR